MDLGFVRHYQIIKEKLNNKLDYRIVGKILGCNIYIYRLELTTKATVFRGTLAEVIEILTDERFLKHVKREIAKDGKSVRDDSRVRIRWKQRRGIGDLIG